MQMTLTQHVTQSFVTEAHVAFDEANNRVIVAMEDDYSGKTDWDCCGYAHTDWQGNWVTNCSFCHNELKDMMYRLSDIDSAYNIYDFDKKEAYLKALNRAGYSGAVVMEDREYKAMSLEDYEGNMDNTLVFISKYPEVISDARCYIATVSNKTWKVGAVAPESFDLDNFDFNIDCEHFSYGHIWENVDNWGNSSPTDEELLGVI